MVSTHDDAPLPTRSLDEVCADPTRQAQQTALDAALGGLYRPAQRAVLLTILARVCTAGGPAAVRAFYAAADEAARLDRRGRPWVDLGAGPGELQGDRDGGPRPDRGEGQ